MLPNLLVIGAMKAATSSLHYYLSVHPEIFMSRTKELDFFVEEMNWGRGVEWYESHFPTDAPVRGESSPNYTSFPLFLGVAERMRALVPGAKLIYLVRDPIERMISHYMHSVARRREVRPIEEAFADEESLYYYRSRYHLQLQQYGPHFDRSAILVISSENLSRKRDETLRKVFSFLGVDPDFRSEAHAQVVHESRNKRQLNAAGRLLLALYSRAKPHVPALGKLKSLVSSGKGSPIYSRIERPVLSAAMRDKIACSLADDVERLRAYTGDPYREWSL